MPTSPHLWIYKWQINMFLSICHRISGFFLYVFLLCVLWFFSFKIIYPTCSCINWMSEFFVSNLGKVLICLGAGAFYYHMFNGMRHLFWDIGIGFEVKTMQFSSILVLFCALILTGITGFILFMN
jgi:succinate dehydrogenase / fumarate reductase cytochrome b subunit